MPRLPLPIAALLLTLSLASSPLWAQEVKTIFHYVSVHGGKPAGQWDILNFDQFKEGHEGLVASMESQDLYAAPVPRALHASFREGSQADVMSGFIRGVLRHYVERGQIRDISDLWESEGWHDLFPGSLARMATYEGRQYFVPQAVQWNPIFYRKDVFEELGLEPPATWEDFLFVCDEIREAGLQPITVAASGWTPPVARWFSAINLRLNGPEFHEKLMRGQVPYDSAEVAEVFEYWAELFERGAFGEESWKKDYAAASRQFGEGKVAMYNIGEWIFESLPPSVWSQFDFFPFPIIDESVPRAEIAHVYGSYALKNSDQPDLARDFLIHAGSAKSQASNHKNLKRLVCRRDVDDSAFRPLLRKGREFIEGAEHLVPLFEFNTHPDMAAAGLAAFASFWKSPDRIDETLETLEAARIKVFSK